MRVPLNRRPGCSMCAVGPSAIDAEALRSGWGQTPAARLTRAHGRPSAVDLAFTHTHPARPPRLASVQVSDGDLAARRSPALRRSPPAQSHSQAAQVRTRSDPFQLLVSAHRRHECQGRQAPPPGPHLRARASRL